MIKRRAGGATVRAASAWAGVVFLASLSLAQDPAPASSRTGLFVQAARLEAAEAQPMSVVAVFFRVANTSPKAHEFSGRAELPPSWQLVVEEPPFRLEPGAEATCLVSAYVPVQARVGRYDIGYSVRASDDETVAGRAEAPVFVPLVAGLAVVILEAPAIEIAGEAYSSRFLVVNRSNDRLNVALVAKSGSGFKFVPPPASLSLEAGASRTIEIPVRTDASLRVRERHQLRLSASASVRGHSPLHAFAMTEVDIIPRVFGIPDYHFKLPVEVAVMGSTASGSRRTGQFHVAGAGALDAEGLRRVDFRLRGPGRPDYYVFGLQQEEYRASYESPAVAAHVGDKAFRLTRLTEYGEYGRGLEVKGRIGRFSLGGYAERALFRTERLAEKAVQLSCRAADSLEFSLSGLDRAEEGSSNRRLLSFSSRWTTSLADVSLEISSDEAGGGLAGKSNSAVWFEGRGKRKTTTYGLTLVRSGPDYKGYYRNLSYQAADLAFVPASGLSLRGSFLSQRRNQAVLPYFNAFYDRTIQFGADYRLNTWLNLTLDQRTHDRQDLSADGLFDYRDSTLRLGSFVHFGTFFFQNMLDFGRTRNKLSGETECLTEITLSGSYIAGEKFNLDAYLYYRGQNQSFTGDKERRLDFNLRAGTKLGRVDLQAFFRTAIHRELYRSIFSEALFDDPTYVWNNYDVLGLDATLRLANGHRLSVRLQRTVNPLQVATSTPKFVGLVEYTIPVGIPVRRKPDIGQLRGRIGDAEKNGRGIAGIIVKANDLATVTDRKGEYVFHGLPAGSYNLSLDLRRAGMDKITAEKTPLAVEVPGGKTVDCPLEVVTGGGVEGRIIVLKFERNDAASLVKMPGEKEPEKSGPAEKGPDSPRLVEAGGLANTPIELSNGEEVFERTTDENGAFSFTGLRPGTYTLSVSGDRLPEFYSLERDTVEVTVRPGATAAVTFRAVPQARSIEIISQGEATLKIKK